jgi:hypothetical protein
MLVAGIWIVLLGICFVIVSLVIIGFRWQNLLLLRRLRAAPRLGCGAVAAGRRPVVVTGTTAPGPAGLLRSPAYDVPSVWFHTDVIRIEDKYASASESRIRPLVTLGAGEPIGVTDRTGTVLLDLALVRPAGPPVVRRHGEQAGLSRRHRAEESGGGMARLEAAGLLPGAVYGTVLARWSDLREEVVEPGQPVTVLGRPRRDRSGAVRLGRPGAVSTDPPDAWIERLLATNASDAFMLRMLPIGLAVAAAGAALVAVAV